MGIFGAMNTAVSGLRAQSSALENISGNIANSQTVGFKRLDTTFADLVSGGSAKVSNQIAGMVMAFSRATNTLQGDVTASTVGTNMAVNGDGYFVVQQKVGEVDGRPVFAGVDLYTRRGDFEMDRDGYLVNGGGYYLKGLRVDQATGNASGSVPELIQLTSDLVQAEATTSVDYRANLAKRPLTNNYDAGTPNSELLDAGLFSVDPTTNGAGTVLGTDADTFIDNSIAGGAITIYDADGTAHSLQLRWAKIDSVAAGGSDTWNLFYMADSDAGPADVAWQNTGTAYVFDSTGQLSPAIDTATITAVTIDGSLVGDITLKHGSTGLSQYADTNGAARITALAQNGSPSGELVDINVDDDGRIIGTYSNGKSVPIASIPLVSFNADSGLRRLDGGAFSATPQSGSPILGANGVVVGQSLEASNTDIADEFSKLIVTQQAYNANTRIISTADEMVKEVLNVVR